MQYVGILEVLTLASPTGLRPEMLVAMSFGVIFFVTPLFLVNQLQRTPVRCSLIYESYYGI